MFLSSPIQSVIPSAHGAVLGVLARTTEPLSGRRIAALTRPRFSQSRVNRVLGELVRAGLADMEVRSPAFYYRLNRDHVAVPAVLALASMWKMLLNRIQAAIQEWAIEPVAVWLFGSAARAEADGSSDIDILVVRPELVPDEVWQRQLDNLEEQVRRWSGNACELLVLSEQELRAADLRGDRLVDELRRDAVHLYGAQPRSLLGQTDR